MLDNVQKRYNFQALFKPFTDEHEPWYGVVTVMKSEPHNKQLTTVPIPIQEAEVFSLNAEIRN
jgi:hypothetical protein